LRSITVLIILCTACGLGSARQPALQLHEAGPAPDGHGSVRVILVPVEPNGRVASVEVSDFMAQLDGRAATIVGLERHREPPEGMAVMMLLDTSGSMRGAKIEKAQAAVAQFIDRKAPQDRIALITFDSSPVLVQDFTTDANALHAALRQASAIRHDTALYDALNLAQRASWNARPSRRAIVVLTDGQDNASHSTVDDVVYQSRQRGVPIYVIGLGPGVNMATLDRLGMTSGGGYYNAETGDLSRVYENIWHRLTDAYVLDLKATMPPGGYKRVRVTWIGTGTDSPSAETAVIPPSGGWEAPTVRASRAAARVLVTAIALVLIGLVLCLAFRRPRRKREKSEPASLFVTGGPSEGAVFDLGGRKTLVGRGSDADVQLLGDEEVSRIHLMITRCEDGRFAIKDLSSRNGVWLNGSPVSSAMAQTGDEIRIGRTRLILTKRVDRVDRINKEITNASVR